MPTISDDEAILKFGRCNTTTLYLVAAKREDGAYKALAERLQRKPPEQQFSQTTATKRKKA